MKFVELISVPEEKETTDGQTALTGMNYRGRGAVADPVQGSGIALLSGKAVTKKDGHMAQGLYFSCFLETRKWQKSVKAGT